MPATNPILDEISNLSPAAQAALVQAHGAATNPTTQAATPAPAAPPAPAPMQPPGAQAPKLSPLIAQAKDVAATPAPSGTMSAPPMSSPMPSMPAPTMPNVIAPRGTVQGDENERGRLLSTGSGESQLMGKIENSGFGQAHPLLGKVLGGAAQGLATLGDVGVSAVAPEITANLPGTAYHHDRLVKQASNQLTQDETNNEKEAQTKNLDLQPEYREAMLELGHEKQDEKEVHDQGTLATQAAKLGMKLDPTTGDYVGDENSPVYQSRKIHDDVQTAQQSYLEAEREVKLASNDPSSPAYRLAVSKANTARINAGAAVQRAQAYYGNYLQHAYNTGLGGETLPGAPQIEDNAGHVTTVGSTNAGQAVKAQANVAQFNDVHGALDNLESTARALVQSGGSLNSPAIIYAFQHASGTPSQFVQSLDKAGLSPQERQYVLSVQAAHENVQALRKAAGGTATDSSVEKLDQLIPNGTTPDLDYLLKQTNQIRQTADRLGKGVTTVKGGAGMHGGTANQGGGEGGNAPKVGDVVDGYQYTGGDPAQQTSWKKAAVK